MCICETIFEGETKIGTKKKKNNGMNLLSNKRFKIFFNANIDRLINYLKCFIYL